ncbi:MAG: sugar-binding domain-containing protein [Pirellulaceae bacterium]
MRWLVGLLLLGPVSVACAQERVEHSLDGLWQLQVEGESQWHEVTVPDTFEKQIDVEFDGIATLRKTIEPVPVPPGRRLILHFDAVATVSTVWFNGVEVGQHIGGWTPFRMDVTEAARNRSEEPWEIRVRVDERVGHNTQGFLPVIGPHFGGIWQSVRLIDVPKNWIDETKLWLRLNDQRIDLKLPVTCSGPQDVRISIREQGRMEWKEIFAWDYLIDGEFNTVVNIPAEDDYAERFGEPLKRWSPANPVLYEVKIELLGATTTDSVFQTVGIRDFQINGPGFLLNDQSLNIRGLLNWGYAPPRTAPSLDEAFMRREIEFAKSRGFNLIKFCLWMPPRRYLELCDELGMLAWIEYPTWHPDFSAERLEELQREYDEFFRYDRSHPSVILRSLTCETGPSADIQVIQSLYDRCKQLIPGAVVVDDSSWIEWNRVFDFYDDHPYGNNHTWLEELNRLREFILARETKPLLLGEAITADTWTDPAWFDDEANSLPDYCQAHFLESSRLWLDDSRLRYGESAIEHLLPDSNRYAMLMRKYQMETFRRDMPDSGFVVSVIRDMPKAAMGLIDFRGQDKWQPADWAWHGDRMLVLKTGTGHGHAFEDFQRGYIGGQTITAEITGVGFGDSTWPCELSLSTINGSPLDFESTERRDAIGRPVWSASAELPAVPEPTPFNLRATCKDENGNLMSSNQWQFWLLPDLHGEELPFKTTHSFLTMQNPPHTFNNLFRPRREIAQLPVLLTATIDEEILQQLDEGRKVVLLANNQPNSFPTESHWFLRGGPIVSETCAELCPRDLLVETQHFDMAGDVIRDIQYLDAIDPLLMLWEAHDLDHIKTNGLLFHLPVGRGNLFVSALNHSGSGTAGDWLLQKLVSELANGDLCDTLRDEQRGGANLVRLRREIGERKILLDQRAWKFQPDPDEQGKVDRWFDPGHVDSAWSAIRIDRHWESQGHESLDDWAWYRLSVDIPENWDAPATWLNFSGVDDYYDLYVNGVKVGSGGDIEKRETAFELRSSHDISEQVQAGSTLQITVAVYDWYGAGGIFRPVWISTEPITGVPRMLR